MANHAIDTNPTRLLEANRIQADGDQVFFEFWDDQLCVWYPAVVAHCDSPDEADRLAAGCRNMIPVVPTPEQVGAVALLVDLVADRETKRIKTTHIFLKQAQKERPTLTVRTTA